MCLKLLLPARSYGTTSTRTMLAPEALGAKVAPALVPPTPPTAAKPILKPSVALFSAPLAFPLIILP